MQPLRADQIRGNWATILLPINDDDSIDFGRLAAEVDYLMAGSEKGGAAGRGKLDGVYTNGTAGEFYAQSEDEFDRIQVLVAERCERHHVPFQIGAGHMDPLIALSRLRRAVVLRPAAIQLILPDWFPLSPREQLAFLQRAAEIAGDIGLVLYNPPHAKRVLTPVQVGALAREIPTLVGVKMGGGDSNWYAAMREHCPGLSVFIPGHHLATGISQGAHGAYSNVACLSPYGAQAWYAQMQTDLPAALALEARIRHFFDEYVTPFIVKEGYANQAADKLLAAVGGWADVGTRLRRPYRFIPAETADGLRGRARTALPELFEAL